MTEPTPHTHRNERPYRRFLDRRMFVAWAAMFVVFAAGVTALFIIQPWAEGDEGGSPPWPIETATVDPDAAGGAGDGDTDGNE
jgi:hypothetical protein